MRSVSSAVIAAVLAAALFGSASAAPSTTHLDDLRTFMQTTRDAIPLNSATDLLAQRTALTKGLAALNATSTSLDGDVRIFGKVATAIDIPVLRPVASIHLQDAIVGLFQDASPARDALAARIDGLVSAKLVASARRSLADINSSLGASIGGPGGYVLRAKVLRFALATIASTNARIARATAPRGSPVRPGVGYFAALVDGAPYVPAFGGGRVSFDSGFVSEVTLTGYFPSAQKGGIEISWSTGSFTGPGVYMLDGTSGAFVVLNDRGQTFYSDGSGGLVTPTEYSHVTVTDYDPVKKRIAGTFDVILVDAGALGGTRTITKGSFDVRRYATTGQ